MPICSGDGAAGDGAAGPSLPLLPAVSWKRPAQSQRQAWLLQRRFGSGGPGGDVPSMTPPTSSSESLDSGWLGAPLRKGSMGCPILAMREMRLALVVSGF